MDDSTGAVPYTAFEADEKFERARSRSLIRSLLGIFFHRPDQTLLSFDQVQELLRSRQGVDLGIQTISISSIVGSVGRYQDFNRAFLPLGGADEERWKSLDIAMNKLRSLPPIDVYKIGDVYFVRDGNHRVSVAKANGLETMQATVTEIEPRVPLTPDIDVDDLIIKAEYARFLEQTHLDESRPELAIELTEPGHYQTLLEHIEVHRYYLGLEWQREPSPGEAAASWYDTVYCPVVEAIQATGVMGQFPQRTEADLYLWVAYHRERLRARYGELPPDVLVASEIAGQFSDRPIAKQIKMVARAIRAAARAAAVSPEPPEPETARSAHPEAEPPPLPE
jgi:uncharacterized ParB-like nuclease family protein